MASRLIIVKNKFTAIKSSLNETASKIQIPGRFKGTIIEKWANYWKHLGIDYKEVGINLVQEARERPLKATIYAGILATAYICSKKNPDELEFRNRLRILDNEIILVNEFCHRPDSAQHLKFIERCINEGVLRRLSLGVISFMWLSNYDEGVALYKAMCPHLQIDYLKFHHRIVDIGFWNKWWKLEEKMLDYDVNL